VLVEIVDGAGAATLGVDCLGRATEQRGVGGAVVVLIEEGPEPDADVVERGEVLGEVQAALAQRAPEALHLAARGSVVGPGVQERDAQARTGDAQMLASVRAAVVEVEGVGRPVAAQGADEEAEHVDLALAVVGLERDHVARGVVEQRVDAHGMGLGVDQDHAGVTDVAVPQRAGTLGLPA